jgi:hypothetical protein
MKIKPAVILFLIISLSSCTKDDPDIDPDNPLIGTWNFTHNEENTFVYSRSSDFAEVDGYRFNSDGTLIVRGNSGDCATPPISYANYKGDWSVLNDTLIRINTKYWGGSITYKIDIEHIDSKSLKILRVTSQK